MKRLYKRILFVAVFAVALLLLVHYLKFMTIFADFENTKTSYSEETSNSILVTMITERSKGGEIEWNGVESIESNIETSPYTMRAESCLVSSPENEQPYDFPASESEYPLQDGTFPAKLILPDDVVMYKNFGDLVNQEIINFKDYLNITKEECSVEMYSVNRNCISTYLKCRVEGTITCPEGKCKIQPILPAFQVEVPKKGVECLKDSYCSLGYKCEYNKCVKEICTNGEENCNGDESLLCQENNWVSQGKVVGKCGVVDGKGYKFIILFLIISIIIILIIWNFRRKK